MTRRLLAALAVTLTLAGGATTVSHATTEPQVAVASHTWSGGQP